MSDYWTLDSRLPPGQLVDVGGYRLHQFTLGQGLPTVLLFASEYGWSLEWRHIQLMVAEYAEVCSFDRAGLGWSDPAPSQRRLMNIIDEVQILLERSDFSGPYLLVGYGFGGHLTRLFANLFPEEVLGMVLVNPRDELPPEGILPALRSADRKIARMIRVRYVLAQLGLLPLATKLSSDHFEQRKYRDLPAYTRAMFYGSSYFAGIFAERACQTENDRLVFHTQIPNNIPLVLISSVMPVWLSRYFVDDRDQAQEVWQASQKRFLQLSQQSELITYDSNEDAVLGSQSELVNKAVHRMLAGMRQ
jgi:pimeloyl-ACP methyl ester carboxylesterase